MIDAPEIVQTATQATAVIHLTIARDQIQRAMGPAREEVRAALEAQGIAPAGPWFTRHFKMDPAVWDFEVGYPVDKPVAPVGRVAPSELPATRVARAVYRGGYEGLGSAWGELMQWIAAQGLSHEPSLWERYVDPGPEHTTTELNRPLAK